MRLACLGALAGAVSRPALAADAAHPTVVELFQSQGCSSCPPADAVLNRLAYRPDLLPLSFAVTYWDRLGWKDSFARPAFTARQWDYARAGSRREVATPQMILNGRVVTNGGDPAAVARAIAAADAVWLVRYDPRTIDVAIRAGENGGRTIAHRDIVRSLDRLGRFAGGCASFALSPAPDRAWRSAILVQQGSGGPIVAAARL